MSLCNPNLWFNGMVIASTGIGFFLSGYILKNTMYSSEMGEILHERIQTEKKMKLPVTNNEISFEPANLIVRNTRRLEL